MNTHESRQQFNWDTMPRLFPECHAAAVYPVSGGKRIANEMFKDIAAYILATSSFKSKSKNLRLLEIRCGNGLILEQLHCICEAGVELHGASISPEFLYQISIPRSEL